MNWETKKAERKCKNVKPQSSCRGRRQHSWLLGAFGARLTPGVRWEVLWVPCQALHQFVPSLIPVPVGWHRPGTAGAVTARASRKCHSACPGIPRGENQPPPNCRCCAGQRFCGGFPCTHTVFAHLEAAAAGLVHGGLGRARGGVGPHSTGNVLPGSRQPLGFLGLLLGMFFCPWVWNGG